MDVRRLGDFSSVASPPEHNRVASGGTVRVDPGQMDVGRTIFVGGLPWDIVANSVQEYFEMFGSVQQVDSKHFQQTYKVDSQTSKSIK